MNPRFATIKSILKQKKYFLIFLITGIIYLGIYYSAITYFLESFSVFFRTYIKSYSYTAFSLNIILALLLGINVSLLVYRLREFAADKKSSMTSGIGIFAAALANGCPGCFVGLFPFILSIFGVSATLSILPFNGIELQVLSAVLLSASIYFLSGKGNYICEIKTKK